MKRFYLFGAVVAMAGGLALAGSAYAAPQKTSANAVNFPDGTYNIQLDGFCNLIQVVKPGDAGAPGVQGNDIACDTPHTYVGVASAKGVAMAWTDIGNLYIVINANHTWTNYQDCGVGHECVQNSGTWSLAPNGPTQRGLPDATSAQGGLFGASQSASAGAERLPGPKGTQFGIHFIGYCDGEYLNVPGNAGSPGADGVQTGCVSNPLIGAFDSSVVGMWDYTEGGFYVINPNQTWIIYADCGGGSECYINSGYWAFGPPPPVNPNRTAVRSDLQH